MTRPWGLSVWSTKRPLAKARAFSSSSLGTGSSAMRWNCSTITLIASSMRARSTPACAYSEPASVYEWFEPWTE